ncbi:chromosome partitioning protein ParB [Candidatus Magnetomorum sp. HK-1]|nr:chromosome partitioning protein ParB [Candidatus Magnetomorum sp. HK-1]
MEQIEISQLDLRFESYRLKNRAAEKELLVSILENGIQEPLKGFYYDKNQILLDGFKRLRCAKKLNIHMVPYHILSEDGAMGIINFLRLSNTKKLSILEEAKLIDELKSVYKMTTTDIATMLDKSKAWVSVRSGILNEISNETMDKIMNGQFPLYAYMYILRPFIRINKIKTKEIDNFINLVSDKYLSIREIKILAKGYFSGTDDFRAQIKSGNIEWALNQLKVNEPKTNLTAMEQGILKDLELTQKYMQRVTLKIQGDQVSNKSFYAQANLLSGGILRQMDAFQKAIRIFHDRSSKT